MDELKELGITKIQLKRIIEGQRHKPKIIVKSITETKFSFALIGDTHLGSRYEALDELHTFYAICKKVGIQHVVHCGDLVDGGMTHPGWENEIYVFGADKQVEHVVKDYPMVGKIKTYFIAGSHDYSYWKKSGVEIGDIISSKRKDLIFLGRIQGEVDIGGVKIRMVHPSGGVPYARSYRAQKVVESIASGNKPQILAIGHLHISLYFNYRNISVFQVGSFQRQTPYLMEKALNPDLGGWIIDVRTADDAKRSLVALKPSWIPFF